MADNARHGHYKPATDWVTLPASREGPLPDLPAWRDWDARTVAWWTELWKRPQAVMWEPSGATLHVAAAIFDDVIRGKTAANRASAELRQHFDRHGIGGPRSLVVLRWRIAEEAPESPPARRPGRYDHLRRPGLRILTEDSP